MIHTTYIFVAYSVYDICKPVSNNWVSAYRKCKGLQCLLITFTVCLQGKTFSVIL